MTEKKGKLIDGKALADQWLAEIAVQVKAIGEPLHLAAVCPSDDAGLKAFVQLKKKAAEKVGMVFSAYYPESELEARQTLLFLAKDETVHGIFVELPLPENWDRAGLLGLIPSDKDIDVISPSAEKEFHGDASLVFPPAVSALARVLGDQGIDSEGLAVAVVGQGDLVGKPITHWLRHQGSEVSVVDINTKHPEKIAAAADVIVSGVGVPELVGPDWVKEGVLIIDYGYAKKGNDYVGDVAESAQDKAGAFTPVPGGMGPLVVAATLENLLIKATK